MFRSPPTSQGICRAQPSAAVHPVPDQLLRQKRNFQPSSSRWMKISCGRGRTKKQVIWIHIYSYWTWPIQMDTNGWFNWFTYDIKMVISLGIWMELNGIEWNWMDMILMIWSPRNSTNLRNGSDVPKLQSRTSKPTPFGLMMLHLHDKDQYSTCRPWFFQASMGRLVQKLCTSDEWQRNIQPLSTRPLRKASFSSDDVSVQCFRTHWSIS